MGALGTVGAVGAEGAVGALGAVGAVGTPSAQTGKAVEKIKLIIRNMVKNNFFIIYVVSRRSGLNRTYRKTTLRLLNSHKATQIKIETQVHSSGKSQSSEQIGVGFVVYRHHTAGISG